MSPKEIEQVAVWQVIRNNIVTAVRIRLIKIRQIYLDEDNEHFLVYKKTRMMTIDIHTGNPYPLNKCIDVCWAKMIYDNDFI